MPLPPKNKPYYAQSHVERTINSVIDNNKDLTQSDLNKVYVAAQVETGIMRFREKAETMSIVELFAEPHESKRLSQNMTMAGDPRPHKLCDAHAIVAGKHPRASVMRLILAKYKIRVDDVYNGCWLPRNTAAKKHMPPRLRSAPPHSRIHRHQYFQFLNNRINNNFANSQERLISQLKQVSFLLQSGSFPPEMMLPAHAEHETF